MFGEQSTHNTGHSKSAMQHVAMKCDTIQILSHPKVWAKSKGNLNILLPDATPKGRDVEPLTAVQTYSIQ